MSSYATVPVTAVRTVRTLEDDLRRARWLATFLDSRFSFMGIRFGADAIVSLIPEVGDMITTLVGLYLVHIARKHRMSKAVQARMCFNLLIHWLIGVVPVVGDFFDVAFKGNLRNLAILEKAARGGN